MWHLVSVSCSQKDPVVFIECMILLWLRIKLLPLLKSNRFSALSSHSFRTGRGGNASCQALSTNNIASLQIVGIHGFFNYNVIHSFTHSFHILS